MGTGVAQGLDQEAEQQVSDADQTGQALAERMAGEQ
jgi:hypothetical protein